MPVLILLVACVTIKAQERPNIVFCLADDWGWPHAGAYGDNGVKTPNFDRIAKTGILFNNAFVSSPSCTPSRNAFITGKQYWQLGPGANLWSTLPEEQDSFIHLLRNSGYRIGRTEAKTWGPGKLDDWIAYHGDHPSGTAYQTFTDFLNASGNRDEKPFFFWLGTADPHRPYEKGSGKRSGIDPSKVHLYGHFPDNDVVRNDVADYYYEVQRWDSLVGTVIAELEKRGILENTIIIMSGDHGMPFPRGKGNLYDSGTHVPFALCWGSQVSRDRKVDDFISFSDIAPTLLEAAGVEVPEDMTGRSFMNILGGTGSGLLDPGNRSQVVFGRERHTPAQESPNMAGYPSRGYRNESYLYIRNYEPDLWPAGTGSTNTNLPGQWYADCDGGPTKDFIIENKDANDECALAYQLSFAKRPAEELYDLKKDPEQLHNLVAEKSYEKILIELEGKLQQKLISLNDPRAKEPHYRGFDRYPYYGGGGGKREHSQ